MARESLSARTRMLVRVASPTTGLSPQEIGVDGKESYGRFLRATHAYLRASVPLMQCAMGRFRQIPDLRTAEYLEKHIQEELHHDEWMLEDLECASLSTSTDTEETSVIVAAVVGAQYYHILHGAPWLFLAYMYALESQPPTSQLVSELKELTGLPDAAFRTMIEHQELDRGHADELATIIDGFALSAALESSFIENALWTNMQIHHSIRSALSVEG